MPAEKFYLSGQVEGDGLPPDLTISWGTDHDGGSSVKIELNVLDYSLPGGLAISEHILATPQNTKALGRLLTALTRARTHMIQNGHGIRLPEMLQDDHGRRRKAPEFPFGPGGIIADDVEEWLLAAPIGTVVVQQDQPNGFLYGKTTLADSGLIRWHRGLNQPGDVEGPGTVLTGKELAELAPLGVHYVPGSVTERVIKEARLIDASLTPDGLGATVVPEPPERPAV